MADNVKTELPGSKELAEFSATVSTGGYSKKLTKAESDLQPPLYQACPATAIRRSVNTSCRR